MTAPAAPLPVNLLAQVRYGGENYTWTTLLAGAGLVADLYCFTAEQQIYYHRHADAEHLLYVVQGSGRIEIGPATHTVRAGDLLCVPPGTYHRIWNPLPEPLLVLQVSSPKPWDARFGGPHPPTSPADPLPYEGRGRPLE